MICDIKIRLDYIITAIFNALVKIKCIFSAMQFSFSHTFASVAFKKYAVVSTLNHASSTRTVISFHMASNR